MKKREREAMHTLQGPSQLLINHLPLAARVVLRMVSLNHQVVSHPHQVLAPPVLVHRLQ